MDGNGTAQVNNQLLLLLLLHFVYFAPNSICTAPPSSLKHSSVPLGHFLPLQTAPKRAEWVSRLPSCCVRVCARVWVVHYSLQRGPLASRTRAPLGRGVDTTVPTNASRHHAPRFPPLPLPALQLAHARRVQRVSHKLLVMEGVREGSVLHSPASFQTRSARMRVE